MNDLVLEIGYRYIINDYVTVKGTWISMNNINFREEHWHCSLIFDNR